MLASVRAEGARGAVELILVNSKQLNFPGRTWAFRLGEPSR